MAKSTPYTQSGTVLVNQQSKVDPVREQIRSHYDFMNARQAQLAKFVTGGIRPEALIRFLMVDLQQNEKLRMASKESIYMGLLACAVTGLEPGALRGEAYLVPFGGKAQFMIGWKGIVRQARRTREITGLVGNVVRERDTFDLDLGTANALIHKPATGDRGIVVGAYAIASLSSGHREIEYLDREDLERIRRVAESRGKSPAWSDWPDQMSRKSAIRRLGKRLPLGADYFAGLALDTAAEQGIDQAKVLDVMTEGASSGAAPQITGPDAPIDDDEAALIRAAEASGE